MNLKTGLNELFENDIFNLYELKNYATKTYKEESVFDLKELPLHLLTAEKYTIKDTSPCYFLNNLKENYLITENVDIPKVCFIDIDFKDKNQEEHFKQEYKYYNNSISFEENIEDLKKRISKFSWISANSFSGKGLRFIFVILNYLNGNKKDILTSGFKNDIFSPKEIHISNVNTINKIIKKETGLTPRKGGCLDQTSKNITQVTSPCRLKGSIINDCFFIKSFKYDESKIKTDVVRKSNSEVIEENAITIKEFDYLKLNKITNLNLHYDDITSIISALSICNDLTIIELFYHFIKRNYSGKSFLKNIKDLNTFINYIKNQKFTQYNIPLKWVFEKFGIYKQNVTISGKDVFGFEYSKIIKIDKYIEDFNFLIGLTGDTIINAGTGYGKTTAAINYLSKLKGIKIFIAPTNIILSQTVESCKLRNIECVEYRAESKPLFFKENDLIITNYSESNIEAIIRMLDKKCESIVVDECHKLTDYATLIGDKKNKQLLFPDAKQTIYVSATPEHFIINQKKTSYIKFIKNTEKKRKANIRYFKHRNTMFKEIGDFLKDKKGKISIIYNNDKKENVNIKEKLKEQFDLDFELVSSEHKGEEYNSIIKTSILNKNILTTSILNDGVNINSKVDYVFIIDNKTQSIFDIYQFCNRFRKSIPNIFILRTLFYSNDYNHRERNLKEYFLDEYKRSRDITLNNLSRIVNLHFFDEQTNRDFDKNKNDNLLVKNIYQLNDKYHINDNLIKYDIVKNFSEDISNSYQDYRYFLGFYFEVNEKVNKKIIGEGFSVIKNKEEIKNFVVKYKDKFDFNDLSNCSLEEVNTYKKYKSTIDIYLNRYHSIKSFDNFELDKIFKSNKDFSHYLRKLKIDNLKNSNTLLSKSDTENLIDIDRIDEIIQKDNSLEYFKNEVVKLNLFSENQINFKSTKSINTGLKIIGYKLVRKSKRIDKKKFDYYIIRKN